MTRFAIDGWQKTNKQKQKQKQTNKQNKEIKKHSWTSILKQTFFSAFKQKFTLANNASNIIFYSTYFKHGARNMVVMVINRKSMLTVFCETKRNRFLTAHNWQKWKRVFLTCPCHKIYRDEAVGLKSCKNTWKITIFVKMWKLGQYCENLIFCQ